MFALVIIAVHQLASQSSALSDAGNWAAIVAAAILVVGIIFGWFTRLSHSIHVVSEGVSLGSPSGETLKLWLSLELFCSAPIPLTYRATRCEGSVGGVPFNLANPETRDYIAPQQKAGWYTSAIEVDPESFPLDVAVRYTIQYSRKHPRLWWMSREITGGYKATIPASAKPMTIMTEYLDGPPSDDRVPFDFSRLATWQAWVLGKLRRREA